MASFEEDRGSIVVYHDIVCTYVVIVPFSFSVAKKHKFTVQIRF